MDWYKLKSLTELELFNRTRVRFLWKVFSSAEINARSIFAHKYPQASTTRCSFIQLSELEECRVTAFVQGSTRQHMVQTRVLPNKGPILYPLCHCATVQRQVLQRRIKTTDGDVYLGRNAERPGMQLVKRKQGLEGEGQRLVRVSGLSASMCRCVRRDSLQTVVIQQRCTFPRDKEREIGTRRGCWTPRHLASHCVR